ncbi:MAG: holo-ACP synthase [Candidatus Caldarchaeum sp.]
MIRGIGVDVVEVARIQQAMRSPKFVARILTPKERKASLTPLYVAGRWAAKEAIAKAIGKNLHWHDVEILNDETGKPKVYFLKSSAKSQETYQISTAKKLGNIHLAISHERGVAVAVAIWEAPPKCA